MNRSFRHQGFTLPEVAVVCGLMLVVTAATYPSMVSYYEHQKLEQASTELHSYLLRARSLAQRTDRACSITFTATTLTATSTSTPGCESLKSLNLSSSNSIPILCLSASSKSDPCATPTNPVVFTGRGTLAGRGTTLFLSSKGVDMQYCLDLGLTLVRMGSRLSGEPSCNFVRS